jgi:hypothetical protein
MSDTSFSFIGSKTLSAREARRGLLDNIRYTTNREGPFFRDLLDNIRYTTIREGPFFRQQDKEKRNRRLFPGAHQRCEISGAP